MSKPYLRLDKSDAVLLLVDHQAGRRSAHELVRYCR
jgi:hypothetical protein